MLLQEYAIYIQFKQLIGFSSSILTCKVFQTASCLRPPPPHPLRNFWFYHHNFSMFFHVFSSHFDIQNVTVAGLIRVTVVVQFYSSTDLCCQKWHNVVPFISGVIQIPRSKTTPRSVQQPWLPSKPRKEQSYRSGPAFAIIYSGSTRLQGCKVPPINGLGFPHLLTARQPLYGTLCTILTLTGAEPEPSRRQALAGQWQ